MQLFGVTFSVYDFDATIDKKIHNESEAPGGVLLVFERQYTKFEHIEFGHRNQSLL